MKKIMLFLTVIVLIVLAAACLSACGFIEVKDTYLHFVIDGAPYRDMTVNAFIAKGVDVGEKAGYYFDGWYSDLEYLHPVNPAKVTADATLYGRWRREEVEAVTYTVTFVMDDGTPVAEVEATTIGDIRYPDASDIPEKEGYIFGEWSGRPAVLAEDITLIGIYRRLYTVSFYGDDDVLLEVQEVPEGSFATPPVPPKKASTDQYSYEFSGWAADLGDYTDVRQDMTVYAEYTSSTNRYTYTLHLANGEPDVENKVPYGTQITLDAPAKTPTADKTFTFVGWDVDADGKADDVKSRFRLYADFEAWAVYEDAVRVYSVVYDLSDEAWVVYEDDTRTLVSLFDDEEGSVTVSVDYRGAAAYPAEDPTLAATAQYTYAFLGWDTDGDGDVDDGEAQIEHDLHVSAVFSATVNWYTYRFVLSDGTPYGDPAYTYAPYGTIVVAPSTTPEVQENESFSYTFAEWEGYETGMVLTEDAVFRAIFSMHVRMYTVTFKYKNKTLEEYSVPYGTVIDYDAAYKPCPYPVYPDEDDKQYAYSWNGWTPHYVVTTGNTFTLNRTSAYDYVITWQIEEGRSFDTYYCAGDVIALPRVPTREGYTFDKWQDYDASLRADADRTFVAVWREDALVQ